MIEEKIPSKYQIDIDEVYCNTNKNIIIEAGPGTGKSHTILELLKKTPKFRKTILVAFNKSIKDELEKKVPENVKVSTIHSLAYSVLRQNTNKNYKVTGYKNFILGKKHLNLSNLKEKQKAVYLFTISKIIDLSRLNLCKTRQDIESICEQYNISTINGEINDVMIMLDVLDKYNKSDGKEFLLDFTDMLYLAYTNVKRENFPKYNVVFVDELQDLNPLQKVIVENIISPVNGRFCGVGDFKQAIYSFMGSNVASFRSFQQRPNTVTLPLSVTYRCSKKVTEEANKIFPGLECFEENCEGEVRKGSLSEVKEGDFVICRNNLPLIESFVKILRDCKKCHILGKDFGQSLLTIVNKLSKYLDYDLGVETILKQKEDQLKEKGISNPKASNNYSELVEKIAIIDILKKEFGSFETLEEKINEIFSEDEKEGVILMTSHKSKGLEAERVFWLHPGLIPSKYAQTEQELYQERCLAYVTITRSKRDLIYIY